MDAGGRVPKVGVFRRRRSSYRGRRERPGIVNNNKRTLIFETSMTLRRCLQDVGRSRETGCRERSNARKELKQYSPMRDLLMLPVCLVTPDIRAFGCRRHPFHQRGPWDLVPALQLKKQPGAAFPEFPGVSVPTLLSQHPQSRQLPQRRS